MEKQKITMNIKEKIMNLLKDLYFVFCAFVIGYLIPQVTNGIAVYTNKNKIEFQNVITNTQFSVNKFSISMILLAFFIACFYFLEKYKNEDISIIKKFKNIYFILICVYNLINGMNFYNQELIDIFYALLSGLFIFHFMIIIFDRKEKSIKCKTVEDEILFKEREHKAQQLTNILVTELNSLILIDGEWGIGKTFFIEKTLKNKKNKIFIDTMIFDDRNSLKNFVFAELNKIFKQNGFLTDFINEYKKYFKFFDENSKFKISSLFTPNETFHNSREEIKKILEKFDSKERPIIIVDNIERITDREKIIGIIGFLHDMYELGNIHIIVLSDVNKLVKYSGLDREYLSKFFINQITLNRINYKEILNEFLKKEKNNLIKNYENNFVESLEIILKNLDDLMEQLYIAIALDEMNDKNSFELKTKNAKIEKLMIEKIKKFKLEIAQPRLIESALEETKAYIKNYSNIYKNSIDDKKYIVLAWEVSLFQKIFRNEYADIVYNGFGVDKLENYLNNIKGIEFCKENTENEFKESFKWFVLYYFGLEEDINGDEGNQNNKRKRKLVLDRFFSKIDKTREKEAIEYFNSKTKNLDLLEELRLFKLYSFMGEENDKYIFTNQAYKEIFERKEEKFLHRILNVDIEKINKDTLNEFIEDILISYDYELYVKQNKSFIISLKNKLMNKKRCFVKIVDLDRILFKVGEPEIRFIYEHYNEKLKKNKKFLLRNFIREEEYYYYKGLIKDLADLLDFGFYEKLNYSKELKNKVFEKIREEFNDLENKKYKRVICFLEIFEIISCMLPKEKKEEIEPRESSFIKDYTNNGRAELELIDRELQKSFKKYYEKGNKLVQAREHKEKEKQINQNLLKLLKSQESIYKIVLGCSVEEKSLTELKEKFYKINVEKLINIESFITSDVQAKYDRIYTIYFIMRIYFNKIENLSNYFYKSKMEKIRNMINNKKINFFEYQSTGDRPVLSYKNMMLIYDLDEKTFNQLMDTLNEGYKYYKQNNEDKIFIDSEMFNIIKEDIGFIKIQRDFNSRSKSKEMEIITK